jgi:hypothetical protein
LQFPGQHTFLPMSCFGYVILDLGYDALYFNFGTPESGRAYILTDFWSVVKELYKHALHIGKMEMLKSTRDCYLSEEAFLMAGANFETMAIRQFLEHHMSSARVVLGRVCIKSWPQFEARQIARECANNLVQNRNLVVDVGLITSILTRNHKVDTCEDDPSTRSKNDAVKCGGSLISTTSTKVKMQNEDIDKEMLSLTGLPPSKRGYRRRPSPSTQFNKSSPL